MRPKLENPKNKLITVRCTSKELEMIKKVAESKSKTVSQIIINHFEALDKQLIKQ